MFSVDKALGVVDIQIKERVPGGVSGTETANVKNGSSTSAEISREIKSNFQEFRTRIVVTAQQTNLSKNEEKLEMACNVIADKLAMQVGGIF